MEEKLSKVHTLLGPVMGYMSLCLTARRGVTRTYLKTAVSQLREAADTLEKLYD